MIALLIVLIAVLGIAAAGLIPVVAKTSFENGKFSISIRLMGIEVFNNSGKMHAENNKETPDGKSEKKDIFSFIKEKHEDIISDLKEMLSRIKKKIICSRLYADLHFSCKDAAVTGETCGLLWSVAGMLLPVLDTGLKFEENPEINITPHFEAPMFSFSYEGIYKIRICHIIYIGIHLLKKIIKYKGGVNNG